MLEHSVWAQYHSEGSIAKVLAVFFRCDQDAISDDEGLLYAELKRTLTKKELRLFAMAEAQVSTAHMMETLGYDATGMTQALKKAHQKLRNRVHPRIQVSQQTATE